MDIGLHVKLPLFLSDLIDNRIFSTELRKNIQIIIFHEIPSSESPVVACGQRDIQTDGHDEAFRHFANAPKNFRNIRA